MGLTEKEILWTNVRNHRGDRTGIAISGSDLMSASPFCFDFVV